MNLTLKTRMVAQRVGGAPGQPALWSSFSVCACCDRHELLAFGYASAQAAHEAGLVLTQRMIERDVGDEVEVVMLGSKVVEVA